MHVLPQSVRRLARRERRRSLELSRRDRVNESWHSIVRTLGSPAIVLAGSLLLGLAPLFIPLNVAVRGLDDEQSARDFLSTLWQVEAGTIALTLTLILVSFEVIWRNRFRGSARRFAEEVWLLYAVAAAFVSLIVIAVVLLGWGRDAPGGWAATWAVSVSAIAFAAVPIALLRTLLLMNPATVHERRRQQIRGEVNDAVDEDAFERLAASELRRRAEQVPELDFTPLLFGQRPPNVVGIAATKAGVVQDIKIGRLTRLARKLEREDGHPPIVAAYLGGYVPRGEELALLADSASRWQRWRARRAFSIDTRARRSRLYDLISHLHQEALQAIREIQPSTYDDLADLWVEVMTALPAAWARYGHAFDEATVGEFGRFGFGPADLASRDLYIEARESTKSMHDLAVEAFRLPDRIARRSLDYDAPALLLRMLALYVELYPTVADIEDKRLRERLLKRVIELPPALGRTIEHDFQRVDLPVDERERVANRLRIVFRTVMELIKAIADHDPRDSDRVAQVNGYWTGIFQGWDPEHERQQEWAQLPPDELARRREHNAAVDVVVNAKAEIDDLRAAYRFALAYWALHQLETSEDSAWVGVLTTLIPWLGSVEKMAKQADQVAQLDRENRLFLGWHETPVQMGWAAPRAFLVFVLIQHAPDQIPADIGVPNFLSGTQSREIEAILDTVVAKQELWQLLGSVPADLNERVEALRRLIRATGEAARREMGLSP